MVMLVTLQQASDHLRRDTNADDTDLTLKIKAASRAVLNYLKDAADTYLDSSGVAVEDEIPDEVRMATLLLVGVLYKDRENSAEFQPGFLPAAVTALLYPLRTPTVG